MIWIWVESFVAVDYDYALFARLWLPCR